MIIFHRVTSKKNTLRHDHEKIKDSDLYHQNCFHKPNIILICLILFQYWIVIEGVFRQFVINLIGIKIFAFLYLFIFQQLIYEVLRRYYKFLSVHLFCFFKKFIISFDRYYRCFFSLFSTVFVCYNPNICIVKCFFEFWHKKIFIFKSFLLPSLS